MTNLNSSNNQPKDDDIYEQFAKLKESYDNSKIENKIEDNLVSLGAVICALIPIIVLILTLLFI